MPSWVVDDDVWTRARKKVEEEYPNLGDDNPRKWRLTTTIYKDMGGKVSDATHEATFRAFVEGMGKEGATDTGALTFEHGIEPIYAMGADLLEDVLHKSADDGLVVGPGAGDHELDDVAGAESRVIGGTAGMPVYQPTPERLEAAVTRRIMADARTFPKHFEVVVHIFPVHRNSNAPQQLVDAGGNAEIQLGDQSLRVPFLFRDGALQPFEVFELGNESAVYTQDNLLRAMMGIARAQQSQATGAPAPDGTSPYAGVAKGNTTTTDPGFLARILQIRDEMNTYWGDGRHVWVVNSADRYLDALMQKLGQMREIDIDKRAAELEALGFVKKADADLGDARLKLADGAEAPILSDYTQRDPAKAALNPYMDMRWLQFANLPLSPARIKFLELHNGALQLTSSRIFPVMDWHEFMQGSEIRPTPQALPDPAARNARALEPEYLVVTHNNRYIQLPANPKFWGVPDDGQDWDFEYVPGAKLMGQAYAMLLPNAKVTEPFEVHDRVDASTAGMLPIRFCYQCEDVDGEKFVLVADPRPDQSWMPTPITREAYLQLLGADLRPDERERIAVALGSDQWYTLLMVNEASLFVPLKSQVEEYMDDLQTLRFFVGQAHTDQEPIIPLGGSNYAQGADMRTMVIAAAREIHAPAMEKRAAVNEVTVMRVKAEQPMAFRITVRWEGQQPRSGVAKFFLPNDVSTPYNVDARQCANVLSQVLKMPYSQAEDLVERAARDGQASAPLDPNSYANIATWDDYARRQMPAQGQGMPLSERLRKQVANPKHIEYAAQQFLGSLAGGLGSDLVGPQWLTNQGKPGLDVARRLIRTAADESEAMTARWEKIATKTGNADALRIAKLMHCKHELDEACAKIASGAAVAGFWPCARLVAAIEPVLSKTAADLYRMSLQQQMGGDEIVSPHLVRRSLVALDGLYKYGQGATERDALMAQIDGDGAQQSGDPMLLEDENDVGTYGESSLTNNASASLETLRQRYFVPSL